LPLARTSATNFITAVNAISLGGSSVQFCNVSYFHGKGPDGKPALRTSPDPRQIVGSSVHTRIDSQRRRLGKETG
jgi:hypothetical protein